jgi:hypothetical protein
MPDVRYPSAVWSPDGAKLYGSHVDPEKVTERPDITKPPSLVSWEYDLKTKKKTSLALPLGHAIIDVAPDCKSLLTLAQSPFNDELTQSFIVPLDTLKARRLTETAFQGMRFSPDGKWVIGKRHGKKGDKPPPGLLVVASAADGSERDLPVPAGAVSVGYACWSPDGKRIAYEWSEEVELLPRQPGPAGNGKGLASRVSVADADGRNAKTILRRDYDRSVRGLDWK